MFSKFKILLGIVILVIVNSTACHLLQEPEPIDMNTSTETARKILPVESVTFDVLLVHVPYQNRELVRQLWQEIDEQELDWACRKRLNDSGFRAGLLGASIPDSLSKLLALKGLPLRTSLEEEVDLNQESTPSVSKPITLQEGRKTLIELREDVVADMPVLAWENGQLGGKTYQDVRTFVSIAIKNKSDGSVEFELTPLIRMGTPQLKTRYKHAQLVRTQELPTKTFDDLKSRHAVRPGQFLVLGVLDENTQGLGHYFFTKGTDDLDQKILIIRLLVTQHDEQFSHFPNFNNLVEKSVQKENGTALSGSWIPSNEKTAVSAESEKNKKTEKEEP